MKINVNKSPWHVKYMFLALAVLGMNASQEKDLLAQNAESALTSNITSKEILLSIKTGDLDTFERTSWNMHRERDLLAEELLKILKDPHSSNFECCTAAFYLGELHASNAVDVLASRITLNLMRPTNRLTMRPPAMDALLKIGSPSIPALLGNLSERDDAALRDRSLNVIYRIDGDKDITQLRLEKALKAENEPQKQARLQSALKMLGKLK